MKLLQTFIKKKKKHDIKETIGSNTDWVFDDIKGQLLIVRHNNGIFIF